MELHQVRYYIALCSTRNFTRAAEACNITQPALTRAIQKLEEELGGALFQRDRSQTQLTEFGRMMQPLLEQTLVTAEAAKEHAERFRKSEVAWLRLGVAPEIAIEVVTPGLQEVARRFPALEIQLSTEPQSRLTERLLRDELDAVCLMECQLPERLNGWPLFREEYRLAVAPSHPLAQQDSVQATALAGETLVELKESAVAARLRATCAGGSAMRARHTVETIEQLQHLVALGLGIAVLPAHLPLSRAIVTRPLVEFAAPCAVFLAVVHGRRFSPALDRFVRVMRARTFGGPAVAG
jgi:DNA-binding transcriptional LysR family regulator